MRLGLALVLAVTGGLYLTMVLWSLPEIARQAGGLVPFDIRPEGYSAAEAEVFLAALSDRGRAFYRDTQHLLDAAFPAALAVSSVWVVSLMWRGALRFGLAAVAIVAAAADYAENHFVARLLDGFDASLAETASTCTIVKSGASSVVYVFILIGLIRLGWRRVRA